MLPQRTQSVSVWFAPSEYIPPPILVAELDRNEQFVSVEVLGVYKDIPPPLFAELALNEQFVSVGLE